MEWWNTGIMEHWNMESPTGGPASDKPPMNIEKKRQTTLRVTYSRIPEWHARLKKMQECKTLDALVTLNGPPHHKVQEQGFEIWHYPLGLSRECCTAFTFLCGRI